MSRVFIIAEAGVNHNGSVDLGRQLIDAATTAGADAVKFQAFRAEKIISRGAPKARYQMAGTDARETQLEMIHRLELDSAAYHQLFAYCREREIEFMASPFDLESVDLLVGLGVSRLKIASGEITNAPLLLKIARVGLPVIMSTGMATLEEVEAALGVLAFGYLRLAAPPSLPFFREAFGMPEGRQALESKVTLLHCTTEYPAPFEEVNLRAMNTLAAAFGLPVGYSDHTLGIAVAIAAAARGATVIEKHFTLDKGMSGPDHRASLEPEELKAMVRGIRQVECALGSPLKIPSHVELANQQIVRKSLVAAQEIHKGEHFSEDNLTSKRPGTGISPMHYWDWLGKVAHQDYQPDELIDEPSIADE